MITLEEFGPTEHELKITADMPEQVAIGFIRARRRHIQQLRAMLQWPNPFGTA